ncbi:hypothetical protein K8I61_13455 [bacterium]|nr:hypothetical protein [bacterium]
MQLDLTCAGAPARADEHKRARALALAMAEAFRDAGIDARIDDAPCPNVRIASASFTPGAEWPLAPDDAVTILSAARVMAFVPDDAADGDIAFCPFSSAALTEDEARSVAAAIAPLLSSVKTFGEWVGPRRRSRARVAFETLSTFAREIGAVALASEPAENGDIPCPLVTGDVARLGVDQLVSVSVLDLAPGESRRALLLDGGGSVISDVVVSCYTEKLGVSSFAFFAPAATLADVDLWVRAAFCGAVTIDEDDPRPRIESLARVDAAGEPPQDALAVFRRVDEDVVRAGTAPGDLLKSRPELVAMAKPYFVGQAALARVAGHGFAETAVLPSIEAPPLRRTVLFDAHKELGAKMVPFGGWEMPVHYPTGIFAEHRATRSAAALFDVSHMSVFEIAGRDAAAALEYLLAGRAARVSVGRAAYTYLLTPDGAAIDDAFIYRLSVERYLIVVNAGNADRDRAWMTAALSGSAVIDAAVPGRRLPTAVRFRDLRDAGPDSLALIAFQGPASLMQLVRLAESGDDAQILTRLKKNEIARVLIAGQRVQVARTGYTGEDVAFELFVHPGALGAVWNAILESGRAAGVLPAGLGARDAARLEAGLPLFGHELEGEQRGTLTEAGYGWVPKVTAPWFIGRDAYAARVGDKPARKIVRLAGQGARAARDGHLILDDDGMAAGPIVSFAFVDDDKNYYAHAFVPADFDDTPGRIVRALRSKEPPAPGEDVSSKSVELKVLTRFPGKAEREGWKARYAGR